MSDPNGMLLLEWLNRVRINIDAHNAAERYYARRNTAFAVASVSALVLLGVSATAFDLGHGFARWFALGLSLVGAITSSLQGILNYGASAVANRSAARQFGALRRSIEQALSNPVNEREDAVQQIARQWDLISSASDNVPERIRKASRAKKRTPHFAEK